MSDTSNPLVLTVISTQPVIPGSPPPWIDPSSAAAFQAGIGRSVLPITHEVVPSGVLEGSEKGVGSLASYYNRVSSLGLAQRMLGRTDTVNDAVNVGQHLIAWRLQDASVEFVGVLGEGAGTGAGAAIGRTVVGGISFLGPYGRVVGAAAGGSGGAISGGDLAKEAAAWYAATPAALPNHLEVTPNIVTSDGAEFALGWDSEHNKPAWYSVFPSSAGSARYPAVRDPALERQLTDAYVEKLLPPAGFADYKQKVSEIQKWGDTIANLEAPVRTNIEAGLSPSGLLLTAQAAERGGMLFIAARDPATGEFIEVHGRGQINADGVAQFTGPTASWRFTAQGKPISVADSATGNTTTFDPQETIAMAALVQNLETPGQPLMPRPVSNSIDVGGAASVLMPTTNGQWVDGRYVAETPGGGRHAVILDGKGGVTEISFGADGKVTGVLQVDKDGAVLHSYGTVERASTTGYPQGHTRPDSSAFVTTTGAHSAVLNASPNGIDYGGLLDIVALEGRNGNPIELRDLLANNPWIENPNRIQAGQTIQIPQRNGDRVTFNFANGVAIESNSRSGEYSMLVPNSQGGGTTLYERTAAAGGGFNIRQVVTDITGEVTASYTGYQQYDGGDILQAPPPPPPSGPVLLPGGVDFDDAFDDVQGAPDLGGAGSFLDAPTPGDFSFEPPPDLDPVQPEPPPEVFFPVPAEEFIEGDWDSLADQLDALFFESTSVPRCFSGQTPILLADGRTKPIAGIRAGDTVMAFDGMGALRPSKVTRTFAYPPTAVVQLAVDGLDVPIAATPLHRFLTADGAYKSLGTLTAGERLVDAAGHPIRVTGIASIAAPVPVYNFTVEDQHSYVAGGLRVHNQKPIVVDLDGDQRIELIGLDESGVFFDVDEDGFRENTAWVGTDDGILAWDREGDGRVSHAREFVFALYGQPGASDLEGLRAGFDTNGDGAFDALDAAFSSFGVWRDANQNGTSDAGEFRTLSELGILSIGLSSDGLQRQENGNLLLGHTGFTRADGSTGIAADVDLAHQAAGMAETRRWIYGSDHFSEDGTRAKAVAEGAALRSLTVGLDGDTVGLGSSGDDRLFTTGSQAVTLIGGAGNDYLSGGAYDDVLKGGLGADQLHGGAGNDTLYIDAADLAGGIRGGTGRDTARVAGVAGVTLDLGAASIEVAVGNAGADRFFTTGSTAIEAYGAGGNDTLEGGAGDDILIGGDGADTLRGGAGDDTLVIDAEDLAANIDAGSGTDTVLLDNQGGIAFDMGAAHAEIAIGGTMADRLFTSGSGAVRISGEGGDDTITGGAGADELAGGTGQDLIDGAGGNDTLGGGAGDDTLLGGGGNDRLLGGAGSDVLDGGDGDDILEVDADDRLAQLRGGTGVDTVHVADGRGVTLDLGAAQVEVAFGNDGSDSFFTSGTQGISADGGAGDDNLNGGIGADHLVGGAGNDRLQGGEGHDSLIGGAGADRLSGGGGDDVLVVDAQDRNADIDGGAGHDIVLAGDAAGVVFDLGLSNVEEAQGGAGSDRFFTTGAGAIVAAGGGGNDQLLGGAGGDLLTGGSGADMLKGGGGDDRLLIDATDRQADIDGGTGRDTVVIEGSEGRAFDAGAANVEVVEGSDGADNLSTSAAGAVDLRGGAGNDTLTGGTGADTLVGDAGSDTLRGGAGDDQLVVDADDLAANIDGGAGIDTLRTEDTRGVAIDLATVRVERAFGGAGADTFTNSGSGGVYLDGGEGDDNLQGGAGDDTLVGGFGVDVLRGGGGNDALVIDADDVSFFGGAGIDTVSTEDARGITVNLGAHELEKAAGGAGNDVLSAGSAVNVTLDGRGGNDVLTGGAGADILSGGEGADTLHGGGGDDVLFVDADDVLVSGGAGQDRVIVQGSRGVTIDLGAGIEAATGGAGDDVFTNSGSAGVQVAGEGGNDRISGGSGDDQLEGGLGADLLEGGAGRDVLLGEEGNDTLAGGAGEDVLDGGAGLDTGRFDGRASDYQVRTSLAAIGPAGQVRRVAEVTDLRTGETDALLDVERLAFDDRVLDVTATNSGPVATPDRFRAYKETAITIEGRQLLGNDWDLEKDRLYLQGVESGSPWSNFLGNVTGGTVSFDYRNQRIVFTPDAGFVGLASFEYTLADWEDNVDASGVVTIQVDPFKPTDLPTDTLFGTQWNLFNTGQTGGRAGFDLNLASVWEDYTGQGITVANIDGPVQYTHPELVRDYDTTRDFDFYRGIPDTQVPLPTNAAHSTATSGFITADRNGIGVVGVAYDATLFVAADGTSAGAFDDLFDDALDYAWSHGADVTNFIGVYAAGSGAPSSNETSDTLAAFRRGAASGRGGLGTAVAITGGNEFGAGYDTNYWQLTSSRHVATVAAMAEDGTTADWATPGASVLVTAPGEFMTAVDITGASGYSSTDYSLFSGTCGSTPLVAGVMALMLDANANLGYRDLYEILAYSAVLTADPGWTWQANGAANWNGGGLHVSHRAGYGLVDAHAAVRLAETWQGTQTAANEQVVAGGSTRRAAIPDRGATTDTIVMAGGVEVERVEIDLNISHTWVGDLIVTLISPDGTESVLVNRPGKDPGNDAALGYGSQNFVYTVGSTMHYGEASGGTWQLRVEDARGGYTGALNSWNLRLYGSADTANDTYIYTNEYIFLGGDENAARRVLSDGAGTDTINAAAVSYDTVIDLSGQEASRLAMNSFAIAAGTVIENVYTGDGADRVLGNAAANLLDGGRGADILSGAAGDDILRGGRGDDLLAGGAGADRLEGGEDFDVASYATSSAGVNVSLVLGTGSGGDAQGDVLSGVEALVGSAFADVLAGNGAANLLEGGAGDDVIDGGAGDDAVRFSGNAADYSFSAVGGRWIFTDLRGIDGVDSLGGIEELRFRDGVIRLGSAGTSAPVAGVDRFATAEDTPLAITAAMLLANDFDLDGDALTITILGSSHGTISSTGPGAYLFTPDADYFGEASFQYRVTDTTGRSATASVRVDIGSVNDAPVAQPGVLQAAEDTPLVVTAAMLARDVDGGALAIQSFDAVTAQGGSVVRNADGSLTFRGAADFSGSDSFSYTVSDGQGGLVTATAVVEIAAVNDAPTAQPGTLRATEDAPLVLDAAMLARDAEGDALAIQSFDAVTAQGGSVVRNVDGTLTYRGAADFAGTDTFAYSVSDGRGGVLSATATVTVAGVNDAPTAIAAPIQATEGVALRVTAPMLARDVDGDALAIESFDAVTAHGGVLVRNADGSLTYQGPADFSGTDSFTYRVSDGQGGVVEATALVAVSPVNDPPVARGDTLQADEDAALLVTAAMLAQDADGDPLQIAAFDAVSANGGQIVRNADGSLSYRGAANFAGTDSFAYTVSDGKGGVLSATATVVVAAINDAPVARAGTLAAVEDTPLVVTAAMLAADVEGDALAIASFDAVTAQGGSVVRNADGSLTYRAAPDASGPDSFSYTISDGHGGTLAATATIQVAPVNDAPTARPAIQATQEAPLVVTAGMLARDADGDALTVQSFDAASANSGTIVRNANGTLTYRSAFDFSGTDTFTYTVSDGRGGVLSATAIIEVAAIPNSSPTPRPGPLLATEDTTLQVTAAMLATDANGDPITIESFDAVTAHGGTVIRNADGSLTYRAAANFSGLDSFAYTVWDGRRGGPVTATASVTVAPVNDAPVTQGESFVTNEDTPLTIAAASLLANDSDVEGQALTITAVGNAANGNVSLDPFGQIVFTPAANATGPASFDYTVTDASGATSTQRVSVQIQPAQDAPIARVDAVAADRNNPLVITAQTLLANDVDPDGDPLVITAVGNAANGTVALAQDGSIVFTPATGFVGAAAFDYTVSDGRGGTATQTVAVFVQGPEGGALTIAGGAEFAIDGAFPKALADDDAQPAVVGLADGGFVSAMDMVRNGTRGVYVQRYGASGAPVGAEIAVVTSQSQGDIANAAVGALSGGGFVVTWQASGQDRSIDVYARRYAADGTPIGAQFTLNTATAGSQTRPQVVGQPGGGFVAMWASSGAIHARRYGADGVALGAQFTVASTGVASQPPHLAALTSGGFVVTWSTTDTGVMAQQYAADGTKVGAATRMPTTPSGGRQWWATAAGLQGGGYVVTWSAFQTEIYEADIYVQRFDGAGNALGGPLRANNVTANAQANSSVTALADGGFMVVWDTRGQDGDGPNALGIFGRRYDSNGNPVGNEFLINQKTAGDQFGPGVAGLAGGGFVAKWYHWQGNDWTTAGRVFTDNAAPLARVDEIHVSEDQPTAIAASLLLANDRDFDADAISVQSVGNATHGTVTLRPDGSIVFTPAADFNGEAGFDYTVVDARGATSIGHVTVQVAPVDDAPEARGDAYAASEDSPLVRTAAQGVLGNDRDIDGDAFVVTGFSAATVQGGTVAMQADGSFVYTPPANFHGDDSFSYTISDGRGTSTATVNLSVANTNDAPVAAGESYGTYVGVPLTIAASTGVLANDSDLDGDALVVSAWDAVSQGGGTVVMNADGSFSYSPAGRFVGSDSFSYTVSDGHGGSATQTVTVNVGLDPNAPRPVDDSYTAVEDGTLDIAAGFGLLANDVAPVGSVLRVSSFDAVSAHGGTVTVNDNGAFVYRPAADFQGVDTFTYAVSDGQGNYAIATARIDVGGVNDKPVAQADAFAAPYQATLTVSAQQGLLANDSDVDGDALRVSGSDRETEGGGTVTVAADGSFVYQAAQGFSGLDRFSYRVSDGRGGVSVGVATVLVAPGAHSPRTAPDAFAVDEDGVLSVAADAGVLANDSDPDGGALAVSAYDRRSEQGGLVLMQADGSFVYVPTADFHGSDRFVYTVTNAAGERSTASVELTVRPVAEVEDPTNRVLVVHDDFFAMDEDSVLRVSAGDGVIGVHNRDADGNPVTVTAYDAVTAYGTVAMNADGSFTYTPNAEFNGRDTFTYTIGNGQGAHASATVTIDVTAVNDLPSASADAVVATEDTPLVIAATDLLANDHDPEGDALVIASVGGAQHGTVALDASGNVVFTADRDYSGAASFQYTVDDGRGGRSTATVSVMVGAANDAPAARDDALAAAEDMPLVIAPSQLLANDGDVEHDAFTLVSVQQAVHGSVHVAADGSVVFTAEAGFHGTAGFDYTVADAHGAQSTAHATVQVSPVNDAPVALADTVTGTEDLRLVLRPSQLLGNDFDPDGDLLRVQSVANARHGTVAINEAGDIVFTPDAHFNGVAGFDYVVTDDNGGTTTGTVNVSVAASNDAPTAAADAYAIGEDEVLSIPTTNLVANDQDVDGDALVVTAVGNAAHGRVVLANGTVTFTPDVDFHGQASFQYAVSDGHGGVVIGTATVDVAPVNDAPVAAADSLVTLEDTALAIPRERLLGNDRDAEGASLWLEAVGNAQNGTVALDANGQVTFVPTPNFSGVASFQYTVSDGAGGQSTATVTVVVTPVNDAPVAVADSLSVAEDQALTIPVASLLANDTDADADRLVLLEVRQPAHGSVVVTGGNVVFTPDANFHGEASFEYVVSDGRGGTTTATARIEVTPVNDAPVLAQAIADQGATEDAPFSFTVPAGVFTDVDAGDTFSYAAVDAASGAPLPVWLHFDAATRTFSGTPGNGDVGPVSIRVTATDAAGSSVSNVFTVTVANVNDAPVVAQPLADRAVLEDQAFSFTLPPDAFGDVDAGDSLSYSVQAADGGALPAWLQFDAATRTFTGHPGDFDVGPLAVRVTARDAAGASASDVFLLEVQNTPDAPVLRAAIADQATGEDQPFHFTFAADTFFDADAADVLGYRAVQADGSALPAWLAFDAATRTFSGTPLNGDVGSLAIRVEASDGASVAVATFTLEVANRNDAPVLAAPIADQLATEDSAFSFTVPAGTLVDDDAIHGDALTYTASLADGSALPAWLQFDAATRTFSGTPANEDVARIAVRVTATDGAGASASGVFQLEVANVNDAPTLANALADQAATEDAAFSFTIPADAFADVDSAALAYSATLADGGELPAWLAFDAQTRTFSGTPANGDVGTLSVRVTAMDGGQLAASDLFELVVANTNDAPQLAIPIAPQAATEDAAFSFTVPADAFVDVDAGDTLIYTASLDDAAGSALPDWLHFDWATRTFSGTPANGDVGSIAIRIVATDGANAQAVATFTLAVANTNDAPAVAEAVADQSALEDAGFSFTVPATAFADVDAGDVLSYSATLADGTALPAWLSFDAATLTFSGTPGRTDVGTLELRITATDGQGASASDVFRVVVESSNHAPVLANAVVDQAGQVDVDFEFSLPAGTFVDTDLGDSLSYTATLADGSPLPAWLVFDPALQRFSGMPAAGDAGALAIRVTATDAEGLSVSDEFSLNVALQGEANGTDGGDTLVGTTGQDLMQGFGGADTLIALAGNDTLDGGTGADTMLGGRGDDHYIVDDAGDVVTEGVGEGADTVTSSVNHLLSANVENLTLAGAADLAGTGNALANTIVGNAGDNILDGGAGADALAGGDGDDTYVVDHAGDVVIEHPGEGNDTVRSSVSWTLGDNLEVLELTGTAALSATGNAQDNLLTGNAGNNALYGGAGNDTLAGGGGADTLVGGMGDDSYVVESGADAVTELAGEGTDTVYSAVSWTLGANFENLTLTGNAALFAIGNSLDNVLTGNVGNNILSGRGGNDTLIGGGGSDLMLGGEGDDTYVVDSAGDVVFEAAFDGEDTVLASVNWTLADNVENLALQGGALRGTGNSLGNLLVGNAGSNVLSGEAGDDRLVGGAGADTMYGGKGNDVFEVDDAGDVVIETTGQGTDTVESTVSWTLGAHVERLTLLGEEAIAGTGNSLDNVLTGNAAANRLDGGAGEDTLAGGAGDDTYVVDDDCDRVIEAANAGNDTVLSSVSWMLDANVENLVLTGSKSLRGTGNALDNAITGNAGSNVLDGAGGNDVLVGQAGGDTLIGGTGNDRLDGGGGADVLAGGSGNDAYVMGRGHGADLVQEADATAGNKDVVEFLDGIATDQLWFRRSGSNLVVSVIGTGDQLTVQGWYAGSQYRVEEFRTADGSTLLDSQVQGLVNAMAAFAPPAAGQTTLPTAYANSLAGVIAASWS